MSDPLEFQVGKLESRLDAAEKNGETTSQMLQRHVTECAALQKKVLLMLVFTAGWVVAHSPDTITAVKTVLKLIAP